MLADDISYIFENIANNTVVTQEDFSSVIADVEEVSIDFRIIKIIKAIITAEQNRSIENNEDFYNDEYNDEEEDDDSETKDSII